MTSDNGTSSPREGMIPQALDLADREKAFARYEALRGRLPKWPTARQADVTPRFVADLSEAARDYKLVLFDAYGVLNAGEELIAGVPARLRALRDAGKMLGVVSNSAAYPKHFMMERYARMGIDMTPDHVVSSREILLAAIEAGDVAQGQHFHAMASGRFDFADFEGLASCVSVLATDPVAFDEAEAFLLIDAAGWTMAQQELLVAALKKKKRPVYVANPDLTAPREGFSSLEPGCFAHDLADRAGIEPQFFGKPYANAFDLAMTRFDPVAPDEVLFVGDTLHTDILGAAAYGFHTVLVADHGSLKGLDVQAAIKASGIVPDFVVPSI